MAGGLAIASAQVPISERVGHASAASRELMVRSRGMLEVVDVIPKWLDHTMLARNAVTISPARLLPQNPVATRENSAPRPGRRCVITGRPPGVLVVDDEESITDLVATARRVAISSGSAK